MRLRLLLFARARELVGESETSVDVEPGEKREECGERAEAGNAACGPTLSLSPTTPGTTTAGLHDAIVAAFPALNEIKGACLFVCWWWETGGRS